MSASAPRPFRVVIADDHPAMRAGVRALIDGDSRLSVVAEARTGAEALRLAQEMRPHVLVLDMEMPEMTGVEVARAVREQALPTRILAYSSYADPAYVRGLLQSGASGYVTKDQDGPLVVEAVLAVARGQQRWFVPPAPDEPADPVAEVGLTAREESVLKLLARGLPNADIADALHLSEKSIRNHLSHVYGKLKVEGAREAVAWAWENGLVRGR
jgi:DNA-binding NarL/FixJ family response regulator